MWEDGENKDEEDPWFDEYEDVAEVAKRNDDDNTDNGSNKQKKSPTLEGRTVKVLLPKRITSKKKKARKVLNKT